MDNWVNPDQADLRRPLAVENADNREAVPRPWPHPFAEAAYRRSRRNVSEPPARRTLTTHDNNTPTCLLPLTVGRGRSAVGSLPPNYLAQVYDSLNRDILGTNTKKPDPYCYVFNSAQYPLFDYSNMKNEHRSFTNPFYVELHEPISAYAPISIKILLHGEEWAPTITLVNRIFNVSYYFRNKLKLALLDQCHELIFDFNENCLPHPNYFFVLSGEASWSILPYADSKLPAGDQGQNLFSHSTLPEDQYYFSLVEFFSFAHCYGFTEEYIISLLDFDSLGPTNSIISAVYFCKETLGWTRLSLQLFDKGLLFSPLFMAELEGLSHAAFKRKIINAMRTERYANSIQRRENYGMPARPPSPISFADTRVAILDSNPPNTHNITSAQVPLTLRHWLKCFGIPLTHKHPKYIRVPNPYFTEYIRHQPNLSRTFESLNQQYEEVEHPRDPRIYVPIPKICPVDPFWKKPVQNYTKKYKNLMRYLEEETPVQKDPSKSDNQGQGSHPHTLPDTHYQLNSGTLDPTGYSLNYIGRGTYIYRENGETNIILLPRPGNRHQLNQ